jgi:hypothetical protein
MEYVINIIIGIASAVIASWMYEKFQESSEKKPLNDILNFGKKDELIFVCPARTDVKPIPQPIQNPPRPCSLRILPWCTTEDFLAINNIKSALLKIQWKGKDSIKQPDRLDPLDKEKNIFCICSSKSNNFTKIIEDNIPSNSKIYRVRETEKNGQYEIWDGTSSTPSPTYNQTAEYSKANPKVNLSECTLVDYGYITKITNPFNQKGDTKLYIIAGIPGIGTWGAGECLKKEWKQIYDQMPSSHSKDSNFSALIRITYKSLDIKEFKVLNVIPLA